jgi:hypothetical protein
LQPGDEQISVRPGLIRVRVGRYEQD